MKVKYLGICIAVIAAVSYSTVKVINLSGHNIFTNSGSEELYNHEKFNVQKMIKNDDSVIVESMPVPNNGSESSYVETLPVPDVNSDVIAVNLD